jgi:hypothetical protein
MDILLFAWEPCADITNDWWVGSTYHLSATA